MRDLDSLFARFRVGELYLTGGEPFARPDFAAILRHVLKHSQARVVVETAGLAAPAPDVLPLLRDARVRVESHGRAVAWETPVDAGSRKAPQLRWVWADFGPLARRDCAEDELYWQTRACGANELFYAGIGRVPGKRLRVRRGAPGKERLARRARAGSHGAKALPGGLPLLPARHHGVRPRAARGLAALDLRANIGYTGS